jgi:hypothetical protein
MARRHSEAEIDTRHTTFHQGFVWAALAVALGAGLSIGAHLAVVLGFGFPVGRGLASHVQTHGHVQLVGWAGLMIMGISLHFIPRLAGVPLARPHWLGPILWLQNIGDDLGPEQILLVRQPRVGLEAIVVVDNVACGPAIGRSRMAAEPPPGGDALPPSIASVLQHGGP